MLPQAVLPPGDHHTEIIEKRREAMGYNKPYVVQFAIFLKNIVTEWDWGISDNQIYFGKDVAKLFASKLPITMIVNLYSIIWSIPVGIALGIWAALKKNKLTDHLISTLTMVCISVPSFVYAFLVQYILSYKLQLFPFVLQEGNYFSWEVFKSMIPAILSLSFGVIAGFTRVTRAELTEVLTSEFMLLARTKGLTRTQATIRHAMKNCMVVILPAIFGEFIGIMSGSLIIEQIFSIQGVGRLYLLSINAQNYPIFTMITVFYTAVGLLAGVIVDISYGFIDPRIRMGSRK
jgi:oligopeptide transport system permease protein